MLIGITGSRTWSGRASVWTPLNRLRVKHGTLENPLRILNGKAKRGADLLVSEWTEEYKGEGVLEIPCPADWSLGGQAGFIRNQQMVDRRPGFFLAWVNPCPGTKPWCPKGLHPTHGAADCVDKARDAGIPVHFHPRGMSW